MSSLAAACFSILYSSTFRFQMKRDGFTLHLLTQIKDNHELRFDYALWHSSALHGLYVAGWRKDVTRPIFTGSILNIYSKRCVIRPFNADDIEPFMAYRNDAEWMQYQGFKGLTKEAYAEALLGNASLTQGMQLAAIDTATGTLIGDLYLKQENDIIWLGYTVSPRYAGQGYALETAMAVIDWCKQQGFLAVKAGVVANNLPSINLLNKLGFSCSCTEDDEQIFVLNIQPAH